nr:hypothetical protein CPGR_00273 [Mycolicibacterium malmesburyense]
MASTPSSLTRLAAAGVSVFDRTVSIHSAPDCPVDVPPVASIAARTAA